MKKARSIIIVLVIAFFCAGCASSKIIDKSDSRKIAAQKQENMFKLFQSDADIINEVLSSLSNREGKPDYKAAQVKLELFIKAHHQSKWLGSAKSIMGILNDLVDLQEKVKAESIALDKANAEKAKLKRDYKYFEERHQTETVRLQQENEQLKSDIALLKKLEIQLGQREKMLK